MRCVYLIALLLPAALAQYYGGGDDSATTTSAAPAASSSGVHDVQVGDGGLVFEPDSVTAAVGEKVTFWFHPQNHSVVQSSFDKPCVPLSSGSPIFSGFFPVTSGTAENVFTITITNDKPIWLYCGQASHCQSKMVMVINPDSSSGKTLDDYKSAAASASNTEVPSDVAGGEVIAASEASSPSATSTPQGSSTNAAWAGKATMAPLAIAGGLALALL